MTFRNQISISITEKIQQFILIALFSLNYLITNSQEFINPFSKIKGEKEFISGFDNRRTHIQEQNTLIYGAYLGISAGRNLRFKLGISGTPFEVGRSINEEGLTQRNRFFFFNIGEEFDFFEYKKFSSTVYLQAGYGVNYFNKENINGQVYESGKHNIVPLEAGLQLNYDLFDWMRLKTGGGWRFIVPEKANYLQGYYIKLGVGISIRKLYRRYTERKEERKEK